MAPVPVTASGSRQGRWILVAVVCLLVMLAAQLAFSVRGESQSWDEGDHIFAGYMSWKHADFGLNPEHPPLAKLIATLPLLPMALRVPTPRHRYYKIEAFLDGRDFVFGNDADAIIGRARAAIAIFALVLALLVFLAARELFGVGAGLFALVLMVFEPNLLAHGAMVATDSALSCCLFASVFAYYRYLKAPSAGRLLVTGLAVGLALGVKHSGLMVFPILLLLSLCHLAMGRGQWLRRVGRLAAALAAITAVAVLLLWSFYGFRYAARPAGLAINPPLAQFLHNLKPCQAGVIGLLARWHVLPESYLYGLADVVDTAAATSSYIMGKVYRHGVWFYFPTAFAIKTTLPMLVFLPLAGWAIARRRIGGMQACFLLLPPALYMAVAMSSRLNIGARHILPIYSFLVVLAAGAAAAFATRGRAWQVALAGLLLFHVGSSAFAYPTYLAYANELWGGPANTYKYLTDSNADWAQNLKGASKYLRDRGVKDCWFAYFAQDVVPPAYYGIPCKPLPVISALWLGEMEPVPTAIDGPVLISAGSLSGYETGPGALNPYNQFQSLRPTAVIERGLFVYDGHFEIPLASAMSHAFRSGQLMDAHQAEAALAEARVAVAADGESVAALTALGNALRMNQRPDEARPYYEKALRLAKTVEPAFQDSGIGFLEHRLSGE